MFQDLARDEASKLKLLRLRDWVLRRPELISERLANSTEVTRIARRLGDWVAVFEGKWARKVSLFQLGSASGSTTVWNRSSMLRSWPAQNTAA